MQDNAHTEGQWTADSVETPLEAYRIAHKTVIVNGSSKALIWKATCDWLLRTG